MLFEGYRLTGRSAVLPVCPFFIGLSLATCGLTMSWLQIRLFGPYFRSFSTNSYGYYSQESQNLFSTSQVFASAQRVNRLLAGDRIEVVAVAYDAHQAVDST